MDTLLYKTNQITGCQTGCSGIFIDSIATTQFPQAIEINAINIDGTSKLIGSNFQYVNHKCIRGDIVRLMFKLQQYDLIIKTTVLPIYKTNQYLTRIITLQVRLIT